MQALTCRLRRAFLPGAAVVILAALTQHAQAQLTAAQQVSLRSNCRSDFMAHCMSESPGSKGALVCLQKNVASLSPGCKSAVSATMPPPKAAAAPPPPKPAAPEPKPTVVAAPPAPKEAPPAANNAQANALNKACGGDYLAHCASVPPGGEEAVVCLSEHAMQLSVPCKEVLSRMMTPAPKPAPKKVVVHAAPPPPAPAPAAAAAVAVAAGPTPEQLKALKFTCRRDFRVYCRGVPAGGQEAFACLARNTPRLTPDCRTSMRAIELSAGTPAAASATAQPSPAQQAAIKQNCSGDFPRVCPGVSPGPGALTCLSAHVAEVSPACRASLAAVAKPGAGGTTVVVVEPAHHLPPGITPAGRVLRRIMERNR